MNPKILFRGQKPLELEELRDRLSKYYPSEVNAAMGLPLEKEIFHKSPNFIGSIKDNSIEFTDSIGSYTGSTGLNKDVMRDLRQLGEDATRYMQDNPDIYYNFPTSKSRAKLYRRFGFKDLPSFNGEGLGQVIDTRRIATQDMPYVQAVDRVVYGDPTAKVLGWNSPPPFYKIGDNVVAANRIASQANLAGSYGNALFSFEPIKLNYILNRTLRNK